MGFRNGPGRLIRQVCIILETTSLSPPRNISTSIHKQTLHSVFESPGPPAEADPWLHRPSPPSSVFLMASSSLAPSPQTTISHSNLKESPVPPPFLPRSYCFHCFYPKLPTPMLMLPHFLVYTHWNLASVPATVSKAMANSYRSNTGPAPPGPHPRSSLCCALLSAYPFLLETLASFSHSPHHLTQMLSFPQCGLSGP